MFFQDKKYKEGFSLSLSRARAHFLNFSPLSLPLPLNRTTSSPSPSRACTQLSKVSRKPFSRTHETTFDWPWLSVTRDWVPSLILILAFPLTTIQSVFPGNTEIAKSAMERVLAKDPHNSEAMAALGQLLINEAKAKAADHKHDSISRPSSSSSAEVSEKVKALMQQGMELVAKCFALDPNNCGALLALADYYYHKREERAAERFAERAFVCASTAEAKAQANFLLGRLAHSNMEFDKAHQYVRLFICFGFFYFPLPFENNLLLSPSFTSPVP